MRGRSCVLVAAVGLGLLAGCGPAGVAVDDPSGTGAPTAGGDAGVCREPLGPDDPHPIGQADGEHEVFAGADWFGGLVEQVQTGRVDGASGIWLDQQAGELVVMVTADDPQRVLDELRAQVDDEHADRVVCMRATYGEDELRDLQQRVHEAVSAAGILASSSVDTVRDRVKLSHEGDPEEVVAALGELADHPALVVTRPECADVVELPPDAVPLPGDGSTCGGMDALLTGTLAGEPAEGCLWVEGDGSDRVTIAWPRGWYVMPDGTVHDNRGQPRAQVGDEIAAGGGHVGGEGATTADPCGPGGGDFLLNSLEPAEASG